MGTETRRAEEGKGNSRCQRPRLGLGASTAFTEPRKFHGPAVAAAQPWTARAVLSLFPKICSVFCSRCTWAISCWTVPGSQIDNGAARTGALKWNAGVASAGLTHSIVEPVQELFSLSPSPTPTPRCFFSSSSCSFQSHPQGHGNHFVHKIQAADAWERAFLPLPSGSANGKGQKSGSTFPAKSPAGACWGHHPYERRP